MAEDWRVMLVLPDEHHGPRLAGWLREHRLEEELAERLRGRVVVSQDDNTFFLYANSRDQAEAAIDVVRRFLDEHEIQAQPQLTRWHDAEERWEDASEPLPDTPGEVETERERLAQTERRESAAGGMDQWEVQVTLPDHGATRELADRLEAEGLDVSRRWRYLVIPVASEEDGDELAERLRGESPPEAEIAVTGSYGEVVANNPYSGFALFGGLGN
jgi:hypothetical protein